MKLFYKTSLLTLISVGLVGCAANGPRASLFNPSPYEPEITNPTDVVEVTREHFKAGQGILERQLMGKSLLSKHFEDHDNFVRYGYRGALPNAVGNGLKDIRDAWESTCSALGGNWVFPICWDSSKKSIHFLTESYVSRYDETGVHRYVFDLVSKKDETGVVPMLDYVAANFASYPEIKFVDTKLDVLISQDKALEKFEKGFSSVRALADVPNRRIASVPIFAFLNTSGSKSFTFDVDNIPIAVTKVRETTEGGNYCQLISIAHRDNPQASFSRSLTKALTGEENISSNYSVCKDPNNEFAWNWKA